MSSSIAVSPNLNPDIKTATMSSSNTFDQDLKPDSDLTTMSSFNAVSQNLKPGTAVATVSASNAIMLEQLQSDLAEIDKEIEELAVCRKRLNEALVQAEVKKEKYLNAIMTEQLRSELAEINKQLDESAVRREPADETLVQAKLSKEKQLNAIMIKQLQSKLAEINEQLNLSAVCGERPNENLVQAKVNKEKHLYTEKQKQLRLMPKVGGQNVSRENTVNAAKAIVGYLPTPDKLVSQATIERRNGLAYAKNEMFIYETYRFDAYKEGDDKEIKYRHVKDEQVTVPYPIDLPHYFPQKGHGLTEVDRQQFDSEHAKEGSWLDFQDFDAHRCLQQLVDVDILSLFAITQG